MDRIDIKKESEPLCGNWKSEKPLPQKHTAGKPRDVFLALAVVLLLVLLLPLSSAAAVFTNNVQITTATAGNDQKEPRIAVDLNGASHVTWMGYNPTTGGAVQIWYADNTSGAWSAPAQLTSATGSNGQASPQIAVGPNGASHIIWTGPHPTTGGTSQIWYADNTSGAWSAPAQLTSATGSNDQISPQIAVDSNRASHVTWTGPHPTTGGALQIWYADNSSGAWPAPTQLTSAIGFNGQKYSQIAVDSNRASHITWGGYDPIGASQIWYADNTSGAWPAPTQLTSAIGLNGQNSPQIAVDSNRASHITWGGPHPSTGGAQQIWYADNSSGAWPAPTQLTSVTGSNDQYGPQIAVDSNRASHITWYGPHPTTGGAQQIWYADNTSGAWPAPAQLTSATGSNGQNNPQIAVDSNRASHITWNGYHPTTGGAMQIWYADNTSGAWSTPAQLTSATGSNNQNNPHIAVDSNGASRITWTGPDPTTGGAIQIWYSGAVGPTVTGITPDSGVRGTTVDVTNLAGTNFQAGAIVKLKKAGETDITATSVARVSSTKLTCKLPIPANATLGAWNLWVRNPDGQSVTKNNAFTVTQPRAGKSTWYLAEGTNAWGFNTYITIENPNNATLHANLTYMEPGPVAGKGRVLPPRTVVLPPQSQTTVSSVPDIGNTDFSTKVACLEGKSIAVDRTMFWTGPGAPSPEAHSSIGVSAPAKVWYLPEGSSAWNFETWTLVENPNPTEATVTLTYMTEYAGAKVLTGKIPAYSRATYSMAEDIGSQDSSIKVTSNVPVIAERSQYRNNRREGSCSIGATAPASDYFLSEGTTAWGFTDYVLVQNPQNSPTTVTLTYMTPEGPRAQTSFAMPANSRKTIRINDIFGMGNTDLSTQVHGSAPIIAERAMYWGADTPLGEACHDSIGLASPHMNFYLPDGQTSNGWETWTLVQNPNPGAVRVEVTYLPQGGGKSVTFTDEIRPNSRKTYNMAGATGYPGIQGRASIVVRSLDGARPIMVERSMYCYHRGLGTDTVGAYSD